MTLDTPPSRSICALLPDELILRILYFLDVPELLAASRTSRRLRILCLDPLLHRWRLRHSFDRVSYLLPRRPLLYMLQPPVSSIYFTRTHFAARRLHWSLVSIRLNRSLSRRPKLSSLVSANILPRECCRLDRRSGEIIWGTGVAGTIIERKRKVEREQIKEGLRVWLERKAREIRLRKKEGGVKVLAWRFSRRAVESRPDRGHSCHRPQKDNVSGLRRFFEGLGNGRLADSLANT